MSAPIGGKRQRPRTVKLLLSRRRFPAAADIPVSDGDGVDLGAIGRCLGLDPTTVRLNGHLLSRGPRHVSSVTWASLLSFFSARGFPAGDSDRSPIVVQGNTAASAPVAGLQCDLEGDGDHLSCKRNVRLEEESPTKKNRADVNNRDIQKVVNGVPSDDESICIGRRLKLDDNHPSKKPKIIHVNSGSDLEASKVAGAARAGLSFNCVNALGKRLREDEMVVPVSCKRVK